MPDWQFIIDVEKCENCNNCFLACKDEHVANDWPGYTAPQPIHGHRWMNIAGKERGRYPQIDVAYRPTPCMHCDKPACQSGTSPGQVRKRSDGIVLIDPVKAVGNRDLVKACPYGVIWWNEEENVAQKCTLCAHLLDRGWSAPRCVQACPTGALSFWDAENGTTASPLNGDDIEILYPEHNTAPRIKYKNLYRFNKRFIAGSITFQSDGKEECGSGADVVLKIDGTEVEKTVSDAFGDFKFDGLDHGSGKYKVCIKYEAFPVKTIEVDLKESISLGTIPVD